MSSLRWNLPTGNSRTSPKPSGRKKSSPRTSLTFRRLIAEQLESRTVLDATAVFNVFPTKTSDLESAPVLESTSSSSADSALLNSSSPDYVWQLRPRIPATEGQVSYIQPSSFSAAVLDSSLLASLLKSAPLEFINAAVQTPLVMTLPTPDHGFARFAVVLSPIMEPALAAQFSDIQTYSGQGIDDPAATLRFDVTPAGFHAQVLSPLGAYYIDPFWHLDDSIYISYFKKNLTLRSGTEFVEDPHSELNAAPKSGASSPNDLVESIGKLPVLKRPEHGSIPSVGRQLRAPGTIGNRGQTKPEINEDQ